MARHLGGNNGEEIIFLLVLKKIIGSDGVQWIFKAKNEGMDESDIILRLESWVDIEKELFKERFKQGNID